MSLTTTTLAANCAASDTQISVTSATGFAAGNRVHIDGEDFQVVNSYVSGTLIPVLRGQNGSYAIAHASGANVVTGLGSDFANAGPQATVTYPKSGIVRTLVSYSTSGAIGIPTAGQDQIAMLNGSSALTMTLANPTSDMDGTLLYLVGNGLAAHTVTISTGLGGGTTTYDVATFSTALRGGCTLMADNSTWVLVGSGVATATGATGSPLWA